MQYKQLEIYDNFKRFMDRSYRYIGSSTPMRHEQTNFEKEVTFIGKTVMLK